MSVSYQLGCANIWRPSAHRLRGCLLSGGAGMRKTRINVPGRQRATDASLLRRLESATERIKRLETEIQQLREALALALGEQRAATFLRRG